MQDQQLHEICTQIGSLHISTCKRITMEEIRERRDRVVQSIKLVSPFDGDINYLSLFIGSIDNIIPPFTSLTNEEKPFYFQCIVSTLRGAALDVIRREQPSDWLTLRDLLISEFIEHTPITTLILSIDNIKLSKSVKQLCDDINQEVCKIRDRIKLGNLGISQENFLKTELQQISLKTLKRELPNHLTALININSPADLRDAIRVLKENGEYNENKQIVNLSKQNTAEQNMHKDNSFQNYVPNFPIFNPYPLSSAVDTSFYPYQPRFPSSRVQNMPHYSQQSAQHRVPYMPVPDSNQFRFNQRSVQAGTRTNRANSNQSRIRRFGAPVPMEQDEQNFHLQASGNYPEFS